MNQELSNKELIKKFFNTSIGELLFQKPYEQLTDEDLETLVRNMYYPRFITMNGKFLKQAKDIVSLQNAAILDEPTEFKGFSTFNTDNFYVRKMYSEIKSVLSFHAKVTAFLESSEKMQILRINTTSDGEEIRIMCKLGRWATYNKTTDTKTASLKLIIPYWSDSSDIIIDTSSFEDEILFSLESKFNEAVLEYCKTNDITEEEFKNSLKFIKNE